MFLIIMIDSTYLEIDRFPAPRQGLVVSKEAGVDLDVVHDVLDGGDDGDDANYDDHGDLDDLDDDCSHLSLIH